jgi:hypothetical protein
MNLLHLANLIFTHPIRVRAIYLTVLGSLLAVGAWDHRRQS